MRAKLLTGTALAGSLLLAPLMLGPTQAGSAPDLKNTVGSIHDSAIVLVHGGGGGGGGGGGHGGGGGGAAFSGAMAVAVATAAAGAAEAMQWSAVKAVALEEEWMAAQERVDRGSQRAVIVAGL